MKKVLILTIGMLAIAVASTQAADVKENWAKHCAKCHGEDGKGQTQMGKKLKVKDYTDAKAQESFKDDEAIKLTKEGKKEGDKTLMKGFSDVLSEQEIKDLVVYIRKFKS